MHRANLISLLHTYDSCDGDEQKYKGTILTFVENNPDCFKRSLEVGHITASSWLLNKDHTHALLLHHKKLDRWFQLGGHCDGDSDVLAVAIKEAQEESGILGIAAISPAIFDIDVHMIPANAKEKEHYHYDIRFLLEVKSDETVTQNSESNELRWIDKNINLLPTNERSVTRMFKKWVNLCL